jgi:hypothetical protein
MLLKSKSSHTVGIGYDPRIRFGARTLPRPRLTLAADASTTFNGLYMRPNFDNGGTVPATGSLCTCPDIWIAGTTPVANFPAANLSDAVADMVWRRQLVESECDAVAVG